MMEGCNDVVQLLCVSQGVVLEVPVVDNKGKMIPNLNLFCDFISVSKCVSHDSNQHIQKVYNKHKGGQNEEDPQY